MKVVALDTVSFSQRSFPHPRRACSQVSGSAVEVIGGRFAVFITGFVQCEDFHIVEPHTNRVFVLDLAPPMRWVPTSYVELDEGLTGVFLYLSFKLERLV